MLQFLQAYPVVVIASFLLVEALLPVRFQPTAWACRGAIRVYQFTLSSHLPTQCKYAPTCSHYGLGCIRKYGTLKGGILTTWRLIRCSPLTSGGQDPIP